MVKAIDFYYFWIVLMLSVHFYFLDGSGTDVCWLFTNRVVAKQLYEMETKMMWHVSNIDGFYLICSEMDEEIQYGMSDNTWK